MLWFYETEEASESKDEAGCRAGDFPYQSTLFLFFFILVCLIRSESTDIKPSIKFKLMSHYSDWLVFVLKSFLTNQMSEICILAQRVFITIGPGDMALNVVVF